MTIFVYTCIHASAFMCMIVNWQFIILLDDVV